MEHAQSGLYIVQLEPKFGGGDITIVLSASFTTICTSPELIPMSGVCLAAVM
jgi:hypothetical protein